MKIETVLLLSLQTIWILYFFLTLLPWLGPQAQYGLGVKREDILDIFFEGCVCVFIQCKISFFFLVSFIFSFLTHELFKIIYLNFQIFMGCSDTLISSSYFFVREITLNYFNYFQFSMAILQLRIWPNLVNNPWVFCCLGAGCFTNVN